MNDDIAHRAWVYVDRLSSDTFRQYVDDENIDLHIARMERATEHLKAGVKSLRRLKYERARKRLAEAVQAIYGEAVA